MSSTFINSIEVLTDFLNRLPDCKGKAPRLYIDLEGNNLSRQGTLSLITILVHPEAQIFLIDVTKLGRDAFDTKSSAGLSLESILEADDVLKVFFDIRNDSDALFSLHGIMVQGIEDLQLLEFASRNHRKRVVNGLAKCIGKDLLLTSTESIEWKKVKDQGRKLFAPEQGGTYAIFDQRPLADQIQKYCEQDVVHMPLLRGQYLSKLCDAWYSKVMEEGKQRVRLSQSAAFNGHGRHMALGPLKWDAFRPSIQERQQRSLFITDADSSAVGSYTLKSHAIESDDKKPLLLAAPAKFSGGDLSD